MARKTAENFVNNPEFARVCGELYKSDADNQSVRFAELWSEYEKLFGESEITYYSSPGRIEIVGNHTDHNGGRVMAAAITVDTLAAVGAREDGVVTIKSDGYPIFSADVNNPVFANGELGTSVALVKGVADYFIKSGKKAGGFNAAVTSCVPKAAGVSSSSSFELLIAEIFNDLYNGGELDPVFMAKAAQYAENVWFGKPCGLMDQTAIAVGGVNLIDFADFEKPVVKSAKWRFDDLDIFVIATGGDHSDLTDDYAAILNEMKAVAQKLGVNILIETNKETFLKNRDEIERELGARPVLRAEHFFEENERVDAALDAVDGADENAFLNIVNSSGLSSREKLQNTYSKKAGNRNLEAALDAVKPLDGVRASRVHGGGFAGTILVFGSAADRESLQSEFSRLFGEENVYRVGIRPSGATRLGF